MDYGQRELKSQSSKNHSNMVLNVELNNRSDYIFFDRIGFLISCGNTTARMMTSADDVGYIHVCDKYWGQDC